ncbi:hypothetical protein NEOKW01_0341 [Nematocida sp. AWRm80]|nr:hypothetical protein NEOKW01_0341 [Nematocida sp. AWRm80]
MINLKELIIQIRTPKVNYCPVLFENPKRSFFLLERMLKNAQENEFFTYSTVIKMMSSKRRATKREVLDWLDMLVSQNVLLRLDSCLTGKQKIYYTFTPQAISIPRGILTTVMVIQ